MENPRDARSEEKGVEESIRKALGEFDGPDWLATAVRFLETQVKVRAGRKEWDISTVGKRIRTARELAGMTQHQLAFRLGLKKLNVSLWEREKRDLPAQKIPGLALSLGVTREWLLGETEEGGPEVRRGILRRNQPERLIKWKRKKAAMEAAKAEAARLNALRKTKGGHPSE